MATSWNISRKSEPYTEIPIISNFCRKAEEVIWRISIERDIYISLSYRRSKCAIYNISIYW